MFPPPITPQALSVEEAKLRSVEESIRVFVRVADPKFRQIVPMRYFNLMLSPAEVEAYTADYLEHGTCGGRCPNAAPHRRRDRAHHHRDRGTQALEGIPRLSGNCTPILWRFSSTSANASGRLRSTRFGRM
jgi:hypothetical protein